MHGNVCNWVIDAYDANWYGRLAGKTVNWHDAINWPTKQYPHVFRGGSYEMEAEDCRSAARHKSNKDMNVFDVNVPKSAHWLTHIYSIGFRVVSPYDEPDDAEKLRYWDADNQDTIRGSTRERDLHEIVTRPRDKGSR